jgi:riboflavin kinase/FMN adenylyltransferase
VIEPVVTQALNWRASSSSPIYPTVVTFSPHPQEFFSQQRRSLLTPLGEKAEVLEAMGVEQLVLLPFDRMLAAMSPQEFVEEFLVRQLKAISVSVGQDFRFGCNRSGNTADLKAIAALHNIDVNIVQLHRMEVGGDPSYRISSSAIRGALEQGDVAQADCLLGRPYQLVGEVVQGQQLGRTIGFPTANLQLPPEKFIPCRGVYSVWVQATEKKGASSERLHQQGCPGVMNIGNRPTVNGLKQTIEVHLLDWSGDLYGQILTVSLEKFLRPEQKFPSLEALKDQIQQDCEKARSILALSHPV